MLEVRLGLSRSERGASETVGLAKGLHELCVHVPFTVSESW